jgi:ABC-type Fe3+-hydroxamate transport system substrate-binding protein
MEKIVIDQLGRQLTIQYPLKRIISVVPSITEYLASLGLEDEIAGITKFCIHPQHIFRGKPRIGGTKNLNIKKIKALQPGLIICNKEENLKSQVEELAIHFPVLVTDIITLGDTFEMMALIGEATGKEESAAEIIQNIKDGFSGVATNINLNPISAIYLIWKKPYMAAGSNNFINEILNLAGFNNLLRNDSSRYPELSEAEIAALKPETILLSSEPYPFKEKHIEELRKLSPESKILLVDGEMFSWYGSRLLKTPGYLYNLRKCL